jgi:hypothetical protein
VRAADAAEARCLDRNQEAQSVTALFLLVKSSLSSARPVLEQYLECRKLLEKSEEPIDFSVWSTEMTVLELSATLYSS